MQAEGDDGCLIMKLNTEGVCGGICYGKTMIDDYGLAPKQYLVVGASNMG